MLFSRWSTLLVALCSLVACDERGEVPITPLAPVSLEVNIQATPYRALLVPASIVLIEERPYDLASVGFAGLALVHGLDSDVFYAYDLSCPVENQRTVKVRIDGLELRCERCGSVYDALGGSGAVLRGVGHKPLRRYRAIYDGRLHRLALRN